MSGSAFSERLLHTPSGKETESTVLWVQLSALLAPSTHTQIHWIPDPQYLRMWLYLETGSLQRKSIQKEVIRVGSSSNVTGMPVKRGDLDPDITQGERHVKRKAEILCAVSKAKERQRWPGSHQKIEERHRAQSPSRPQKEPTPLTPWPWTFRLQNCETSISVVQATQFAVLSYSSPRTLIQLVRMDLENELEKLAVHALELDMDALTPPKKSSGIRKGIPFSFILQQTVLRDRVRSAMFCFDATCRGSVGNIWSSGQMRILVCRCRVLVWLSLYPPVALYYWKTCQHPHSKE